MAEYTSQTIIEKYLQRSLTSDEETFLTTLLPAIRLWLDRALASHFLEVSESTRYYDGGGETVDIDPCTSITAVKSVDNEHDTTSDYTNLTDYVAEPQNQTVKNELVRRSGARFPSGNGRIAVTAKFSEYTDKVPEDIQLAATRIAADVLQEGKTVAVGNVQSESLEGHSISYRNPNEIIDKVGTEDPFISQLIESRKDIYLG